MTSEHDRDADRGLEMFFQSARDQAPEPSPQLLSRVLADAYGTQEEIATEAARAAAPRRSLLRGVLDAIGGWPAVAGLVTATAAGLWIGYSPPASVDTLALPFIGDGYELTMESSLPDFGFLLGDG